MTRLTAALPVMSTQQLRLLLEFYEGDSELGRQYAGLRAEIRAELRARADGGAEAVGDDRQPR